MDHGVKEAPKHMQAAHEMLNHIISQDPEHQNDIINLITNGVRENRQKQITELEERLRFLRQTYIWGDMLEDPEEVAKECMENFKHNLR